MVDASLRRYLMWELRSSHGTGCQPMLSLGGSAQIGHHLQSLHPFCSWMGQRGAFCARGESFVALHRGTQCASSGPKGDGRRGY